MKTKEEVIREVWGCVYNPHICENGWFDMYYLDTVPNMSIWLDKTLYEQKNTFVRPKSLKGIENNNGWIPLNGTENEIEYEGAIWIINKSGCSEYFEQGEYIPTGYAIMWQPVKEPKLPLYQ